MRDLCLAVGGVPRAGEQDRWFAKVAKAAGLSVRSVASAYRGERMSETWRAGVEAKLRAAAGKHEANSLAQQFENLAHALDLRDADFHRSDVAALLSAARALRGLDRT